MQQKLMFGLGMSAAVAEADGAGYLEWQEGMGAQQLRIEFAAWCTGLAAEYLHRFREAPLAKQGIRDDFSAIASETDTGRLTDEEAALIGNFVTELDPAIDRLAGQSELRRSFELWGFRTPRMIKALAGVAIACSLLLPIIWAIGN